jgi:hypothetical protein
LPHRGPNDRRCDSSARRHLGTAIGGKNDDTPTVNFRECRGHVISRDASKGDAMLREEKTNGEQLILFPGNDVLPLGELLYGGELITGCVGSGKTSMSNTQLAEFLEEHPSLDWPMPREQSAPISLEPPVADEEA